MYFQQPGTKRGTIGKKAEKLPRPNPGATKERDEPPNLTLIGNPQKLNLTGKRIGDAGVKTLASSLVSNGYLAQLLLDGSNIGEKGGVALGKALRDNVSLRVLYMPNNKIGIAGGKAIGEALQKNDCLHILNLNGNDIGSQGGLALAEALRLNKTLKELWLNRNELGEVGGTAIGDALRDNPSLVKLSMNGNGLGDEAAKVLAVAVQENVLKELWLNTNEIGDEGGMAIGEALRANNSLNKVGLHGNRMGKEGLTALVEGVKNNASSLKFFDLRNNRSSVGDVFDVMICFALNGELKPTFVSEEEYRTFPSWRNFYDTYMPTLTLLPPTSASSPIDNKDNTKKRLPRSQSVLSAYRTKRVTMTRSGSTMLGRGDGGARGRSSTFIQQSSALSREGEKEEEVGPDSALSQSQTLLPWHQLSLEEAIDMIRPLGSLSTFSSTTLTASTVSWRYCPFVLFQPSLIHGFIEDDEEEVEAYREEMTRLASLVFPHVVRLIAVHDQDPYLFLMEHPEGGSLLDLSAKWNHIIPPHMVLSIAADILKALAYLHQKGLSFDHLRYENVWIFGCTSHAIQAKLLCGRLCQVQVVRENNSRFPLGQRNDLHQAGVLLFKLCFGKDPSFDPRKGVGDIPYDDTRCPRLLKNIILECWEGKDLDIPDILMQLKQMQSFVPKEMSLSPWEEVSPEEIAGQKKEHIGQGSFGIVYKTEWRGEIVAVKMMRSDVPMENLARIQADFLRELYSLASLRSPNLVLFLAACSIQHPLFIISEYLPLGNLSTYVRNAPNRSLSLPVSQKLGKDVLKGLICIHSKHLMHRDLTPNNILIGGTIEEPLAKIADFGIARIEGRYAVSYGMKGTPAYMAPEIVLTEQQFTKPVEERQKASYGCGVDIYSFGLVLYFMLHGKNPLYLEQIVKLAQSMDTIEQLTMPPLMNFCPGLQKLIQDCWAFLPQDRPSAMQALNRLSALDFMKE